MLGTYDPEVGAGPLNELYEGGPVGVLAEAGGGPLQGGAASPRGHTEQIHVHVLVL